MSLAAVQSALELGAIYSLVALALFLSFTTLNIADLTTDGSFTLGCAVSAALCLKGHPYLALPASMAAGAAAGFVTAFFQTRLGVPSILAGIVTNTGLYTVNLAVMGFSANLNLFRVNRVFSWAENIFADTAFAGWGRFFLATAIALTLGVLTSLFLKTRLGLSIRATGDNPVMVRASSINPAFTITVGLCLSNALTALSGSLLVQYQKFADINLGTGMVTMALASLIIGETLFGKKGMLQSVMAVLGGSVVYRFIMALALQARINAAFLKLISALIVGFAISLPGIRSFWDLQKQKSAYRRVKKGAR